MDCQEPHKVQQGEVQSLAPEKEQPHVPAQYWQWIEKGDHFPLVSVSEVSSGMLHTAQGSPVLERHETAGEKSNQGP